MHFALCPHCKFTVTSCLTLLPPLHSHSFKPKGTLSLSYLRQVFFSKNQERKEYTLFLFFIPFLPPATFLPLTPITSTEYHFWNSIIISFAPYKHFIFCFQCTLMEPDSLPFLLFLGGKQIVQLEVGKRRGNRNEASKENRAQKDFNRCPVEKARRREKRFDFPLLL